MTAAKSAKLAAVTEPCIRFTHDEILRNKKGRDDRRKSIRAQNARSKSLK